MTTIPPWMLDAIGSPIRTCPIIIKLSKAAEKLSKDADGTPSRSRYDIWRWRWQGGRSTQGPVPRDLIFALILGAQADTPPVNAHLLRSDGRRILGSVDPYVEADQISLLRETDLMRLGSVTERGGFLYLTMLLNRGVRRGPQVGMEGRSIDALRQSVTTLAALAKNWPAPLDYDQRTQDRTLRLRQAAQMASDLHAHMGNGTSGLPVSSDAFWARWPQDTRVGQETPLGAARNVGRVLRSIAVQILEAIVVFESGEEMDRYRLASMAADLHTRALGELAPRRSETENAIQAAGLEAQVGHHARQATGAQQVIQALASGSSHHVFPPRSTFLCGRSCNIRLGITRELAHYLFLIGRQLAAWGPLSLRWEVDRLESGHRCATTGRPSLSGSVHSRHRLLARAFEAATRLNADSRPEWVVVDTETNQIVEETP